MREIENRELLGRIIKSTIGVISRRTSEPYANMVIINAIKRLRMRYLFFNHVKILSGEYNEIFDVVKIEQEINQVESEEIGKAAKDFIQIIMDEMGKDAGYYFIREIKEDLPYDYERSIKSVGLDLDVLQLNFISDVKQDLKYGIKNDEILKYMVSVLYELLERDSGRSFAYETLNDVTNRLNIEHEVLKYIKVNDVRSIQNVDIVTVDKSVNSLEPTVIGSGIQKIIQEIFNSFEERKGFIFIDNLKNLINADYNVKLKEIGVDLSIIKLKHELILRHVLKTLIDILSDASTPSYAVLMVNNILRNFDSKFSFLKEVKIDGLKYSQNEDGIVVPPDINSVRASELGRSLQRIIENISNSMGDEPGRNFIERFKRGLGKAYILRIEELGVNLHMIELRNNLLF